MSIAYKIANSSNFITCLNNSNALAASEVALAQTGYQNQIWQFIAILGEPNTYYLRNINDVYLRAAQSNVIAGNIGNATAWVIEIVQPVTTPPTFRIKRKDTTEYLAVSTTSNSIILVQENIAVNWDIIEHDESGL